MKTTFLVKKNPNIDSEDNWIIMNSFEFVMFLKTPEGQKRRNNFGRIPSCGEGDDTMFIECDEETAKRWKKENEYHAYLRKLEKESGITTFSYSSISLSGENIDGEDLLYDEECNVEESAIENMMVEGLYKAIARLSVYEQQLIHALYLSDKPMTESEFGKMHGHSQQRVHYQKQLTLNKLEKILNSKK